MVTSSIGTAATLSRRAGLLICALLIVQGLCLDRSVLHLPLALAIPWIAAPLWAALCAWLLLGRTRERTMLMRQSALNLQQAIDDERQRIMADMHDGIGAQLITTLGLAETGSLSANEMAIALRDCLDDLRIAIDALELTENDLLPVLGHLRYRLDPRLQRQGITLQWQVEDLPRLACMTPRNALHLLRILQEAFTNILKHARASAVRVEAGLLSGGGQVFIRVRDNGQGFSGDHRGRGLANMQMRAAQIGGVLRITACATGTTLELLLPVA